MGSLITPGIGISIIVPLLDESAVAQELIEHLNSLDAEQVIIVDGGSTDNTLELFQSSGFDIVSSMAGRAQQMNEGAKRATQSWMLFLHADTRLPSAYKSELLKAKVWGRFDVQFDSPLRAMRMVAFCMNWRSRFTFVATGDQAIFINADAFNAVGGFPDFPIMEDVALCKRLRKLHAPYSSKGKVTTSARRWLKNGIVKTIVKMWWYRFVFFVGGSLIKLNKHYNDVR